MVIHLKCPCTEQTEFWNFESTAQVDSKGNIMGANVPFDADTLEHSAYEEAKAFWDKLVEHLQCPGECLRSMSATFEHLPLKVNVITVKVPGAAITNQTVLYRATVKLTIWISCKES